MVIIIGGGITGLSAAYELSLQRIPFLLLESSSRLGGLIFTERVDGYTIECGADSMLVQKPAAIDLCRELGLESRLVSSIPPRTSFVHARGELHVLPSPSILGIPTTASGIETYTLLSPTAQRDLESRLLSRPHVPDEDQSVGTFFRRAFGPETVDLIADPLLGGIHAGDVERLSIRSVAPRLVTAQAQGLNAGTASPNSDGLFRSLTTGMSELVEAIERRLPRGSIRLQREVLTVSRETASSGAALFQVTCAGEALSAPAVIISAPAHAAENLLAWLDPDLAQLCAQVPYVSTASVALAWPRSSVTHSLNGSGFVVARKHSTLRITACSWITSKWPGRAPSGMVLLRAFLGGAADPDVVDLGDLELIGIAVRDLASVLGITGEPMLTRVHRWRRAGAQHNVGHSALVEDIEARLAAIPGLFVAGSGFRSIGIPDCVADGRAAGLAAARYVKMRM